MKVELESGVWLTAGDGDPPRTLVKDNAKEFTTYAEAINAISDARQFRLFNDARIVIK